MNKVFRVKQCGICKKDFTPKAPCNLYCSDECKSVSVKIYSEKKRKKNYEAWKKEQIDNGREWAIGVGTGGSNKRFKDNKQYKNGLGQFARLRKQKKLERFCERCEKDLKDVGPYEWCVHHKDHDRSNNVIENLELLCKKCHQIEHECWKAFNSATTIPKGSTPKQVEAPDTHFEGDDIV